MKFLSKKGITLRFSISVLVISAVVLTMIIEIISAIQVNRSSLISSYLQNNDQYARKLAANTGNLLTTMRQNLIAITAILKRGSYSNSALLDDLFQENRQYFNSIFIANEDRVIQATSPNTSGVHQGDKLTSEVSKRAIKAKAPFISEPYLSKSGRYIILVSAPIFNSKGVYKGFVGGTIYLEEKNVLNTLLEEHFFGNGSYVFVVEKTGHIIFHPDKNRVGQAVSKNHVVQKVLKGNYGSERVTNSKQHDFFAGYAFDPISSWGIVAQTPVSVIDGPLSDLIRRMLSQSMIFLIPILLVGWWMASRIAKPLHMLANYSEEATINLDKSRELPEIRSSYYEVRLLYRSVRIAFHNFNEDMNQLRDEVHVDGLTGLSNRKAFDKVMTKWISNHVPYSLVLLDIDHFKQVNDTYGHLIGDEVLRFLSRLMEEVSGEDSHVFRYGGEEFAILVKHEETSHALRTAERVRKILATTESPTGEAITISAGIATFPDHALDAHELIRQADRALYQSKLDGRNRTTVSDGD
ncbi:sensor domain-containing diguanylate cyclase [Paenibacillus tuaregi]|uniref:sensor domain-containing diguanylate cyclase n=1 Tax=Paenibacillus tuaregi TaxID=1816681 RepID=UPI000838BB7B|nr:sensor domain-containing diguanylate cyclase [Paenibacillus tuaregi]